MRTNVDVEYAYTCLGALRSFSLAPLLFAYSANHLTRLFGCAILTASGLPDSEHLGRRAQMPPPTLLFAAPRTASRTGSSYAPLTPLPWVRHCVTLTGVREKFRSVTHEKGATFAAPYSLIS